MQRQTVYGDCLRRVAKVRCELDENGGTFRLALHRRDGPAISVVLCGVALPVNKVYNHEG